MNVLAFAASSSNRSINKTLAAYTANLIDDAQVEVLDINDYEMPLFSDQREQELGQPELARKFFRKIGEADAVIISYAEHNGSYTAAYKNLFDWTSRINSRVYQNRPMLMLSASPGAGGARNVLASAQASAPHFAADLKGCISVPSFYDNFDVENNEVTNEDIKQELQQAVQLLRDARA
jgi:NAD(P)H-dependent FMN reductase